MKIEEAAERCKVRGYISQGTTSDPMLKLWKNTRTFDEDIACLKHSEPSWECFDPEGEELLSGLVG